MKKYLVGMNGRFNTVQPDLVSIYRLPESSNSGISPYIATYFAYINDSKEVVINSIHNSYVTAFQATGNTGVFTEQVYSLPVGEFASKLYTTGTSIAVITESGNVYMMGFNGNAMCGIRVNNTVVATDPINSLIRGFTSDASGNLAITDPFSKIIFGSDIDGFATFALTTTGKLYAAGSNDFGQLANGTTTNSDNASINGPRRVTFSGIGQNRTVSDAIGVGGRATTIPTTLVVLDTSGIVWAAGYGGQGQIGQSTTADVNNLLRRVKSSATTDLSNGIVAIYGSGGDNSTTIFAVHTSGDLYVWGNNNSNTKYDGTTGNIVVAKKINSFFNNESVTKVWTGFYFSTNTFVRTSTGKIYGTGSGQALGISSTSNTSGWQELKFFNTTTRILDNFYIGHVDNGADITFARTYDTNGIYSLWVTGKNNQGSAGIGMTSDVRTWIEVSLPPEIVRRIVTIASSNWGSRFGIDTGTTIIHLDDGTALIAGKHLPLSNNNTVFSKFVPLCRYITSEEPN
jgi:alpha-tubulin suppressor-like RCC1 family protein